MNTTVRQWAKFEYFDPKVVLPKLQSIRNLVATSDLPPHVKNLLTRDLQPERESWDAAVLCYLLGEVSGLDIRFSRTEASDYDSIFYWVDEESPKFAPVQLKELVPECTNPKANIGDVFEKLKKYVDSDDLVVGIKLNRRITLEFTELDTPELPVREIWLFGATKPDESEWSLFGKKNGEWTQWKIPMPSA